MINPMKLKDYVTVAHMLCGIASIVAALDVLTQQRGSLEWAGYWIIIALVFDTLDGLVARLTGGGNQFGEVLDNIADLVVYSFAPTILIFVAYCLPREVGGAGWSNWSAGLLASFPTIFGCIRFSRNSVKSIKAEEFHLGLPRPAQAVYLASIFPSHLFQNNWMQDLSLPLNPIMYILAGIFIVMTSWMTLPILWTRSWTMTWW